MARLSQEASAAFVDCSYSLDKDCGGKLISSYCSQCPYYSEPLKLVSVHQRLALKKALRALISKGDNHYAEN